MYTIISMGQSPLLFVSSSSSYWIHEHLLMLLSKVKFIQISTPDSFKIIFYNLSNPRKNILKSQYLSRHVYNTCMIISIRYMYMYNYSVDPCILGQTFNTSIFCTLQIIKLWHLLTKNLYTQLITMPHGP